MCVISLLNSRRTLREKSHGGEVLSIHLSRLRGLSQSAPTAKAPVEPYHASQECHGEGLVEHTKLSALRLLVIGVTENAAVEQRPVYVCHHRTDVPRAVGRLAIGGVFDALQVLVDRLMEVHRVPFVEGVDLATRRDLDLSRSSQIVRKCSPFIR